MPRFSIVIPCYNGAAYLGETLASCRAQTEQDLEILVVDDGSTDASPAIAAAAAAQDDRIRVIRQENRGLGAARNTGLTAARGAFVNFLDADDLLEPDKLAVQGAILESRPEVGIVLCLGTGIDEQGRTVWEQLVDANRFLGHPPLFEVLFRGGAFAPMVPLLRTDVARAVGGFDERRDACGWADTGFWMRVALTGVDYHLVEAPLVVYRVLSTSMSADRGGMARAAALIYGRLFVEKPDESARALLTTHWHIQQLTRTIEDLRQSRRSAKTTLLSVLARTHGGPGKRALMIWGAGAGGRRVLALWREAGGVIDAFLDSDPSKAGARVDDVPVIDPRAVRDSADARPFVLIASMQWPAIADQLETRGWTYGTDYYVAEFDESDVPTVGQRAPLAVDRYARPALVTPST